MNLISRAISQIRNRMRRPLEQEFAVTQKLADRKGMTCVLFILHAPHCFHPVSQHFDGSTDQEARIFLSMLLGQVYKSARLWNITWMGFSMLEPDTDGVSRLRVIAWVYPESLKALQSVLRNAVRQHCRDDRCLSFLGVVNGDPHYLFGEHHKFTQLTVAAVEPRRKWKAGLNIVQAVLTGRAA